jgi:hypothetical protein
MGHDLALSDIFVADSFITTFLCRRSGTPSCTRGAWAWTLRGTTTAGCGGRPRGRRGRCSRGISAELPALGILRGTTGCVCHPSLGSSCTNRADTVFLRSGFELPHTQLNCCLRVRGLLARNDRPRKTWLRSAGVSRGKVESYVSPFLVQSAHASWGDGSGLRRISLPDHRVAVKLQIANRIHFL